MEAVNKLCQEIVAVSQLLSSKQLVAGSWGNVSARVTESTYAITPSGRSYATLTAKDIVLINDREEKLAGTALPSSEAKLHLAIYQNFPQAGAILHTHSLYASTLAAAHKDLPPIMEDTVQVVGGRVNCARYALPGTEQLASNVVAALGDKRAALLANHGVVCWGRDLQEAVLTAELVEKAAQIYCMAANLGGAQELTPEAIKIIHAFYIQHYAKRQRGEE